jgi:ABC-type nitrate/sulfonate/bicarbonate transport system ATPase subunit
MIPKKLRDRDRVLVVDQQRRLLRWTGINNNVDLRAARRQLCPIFDLVERLHQ